MVWKIVWYTLIHVQVKWNGGLEFPLGFKSHCNVLRRIPTLAFAIIPLQYFEKGFGLTILDPICTILNHYFFCLSYFQLLALNLPLVCTPFCLHARKLCWKIWVSHIDTYAQCVTTIWRWNPNPPWQTFQIDSLYFKAFSFCKIPKFEIIFNVGEGTSFLAFLGFWGLGILPSTRPSNPWRSPMRFITQYIKLSYLWDLVLGDNFLQFFELENMILNSTKDF